MEGEAGVWLIMSPFRNLVVGLSFLYYNRAREDYKRQVESLKEELERSTQAFNLYRARAHTALKKTAEEQHTAEERLSSFQSQIQVSQSVTYIFWTQFKGLDSRRDLEVRAEEYAETGPRGITS